MVTPKLEEAMQGLAKGGRLTDTGLSTAYTLSRAVDYYTAHTAGLLWAEVARLVALRMAAEAMPGKAQGGER